jgi:hypothetical protein
MMVSNLGVLPFDADFGDLRLEALWGPSASRSVCSCGIRRSSPNWMIG